MAMDNKKCSMFGCKNTSANNEIYFFRFPKNFNLCMLWVQNCGCPEFFEDFAFGGAQPFLNRHLCSNHFADKDFIKKEGKVIGILPEAVPQLNLNLSNEVEIKDELFDIEFVEVLTVDSESDLLKEIKLENTDNNSCDDTGTNFSMSSNDESCSDLFITVEETAEEKQLSEDFFRDYKRTKKDAYNTSKKRRGGQTNRLKTEALRARLRRLRESDEQRKLRCMKNALRAAFRRKNETPEQKEARRRKDMLRAQRKRKTETEAEAAIRRYNDAVRAAYRRNNESEEKRQERKLKDLNRVAKKRSMETAEQREQRLLKDRIRASKKRMVKKIFERLDYLGSLPEEVPPVDVRLIKDVENMTTPLLVSSIASVVTQCNESNDIERLQQVLKFTENKTGKKTKTSKLKNNEEFHFTESFEHLINLNKGDTDILENFPSPVKREAESSIKAENVFLMEHKSVEETNFENITNFPSVENEPKANLVADDPLEVFNLNGSDYQGASILKNYLNNYNASDYETGGHLSYYNLQSNC